MSALPERRRPSPRRQSRSHLRVFSPREEPPKHPAIASTLRDVYEQFILPELQRADRKGSQAQYNNALNHWETRTENPCLRSLDPDSGALRDGITDEVVELFRESLQEDDLANDTIMKIWRQLRPIFCCVARRIPRCNPQGRPAGQEWIDDIPYFRPLDSNSRIDRCAMLEHLSAIYEACSAAKWPRCKYAPAPLIWRCLFAVVYNHGLRTGDLINLKRSAIHWDPAHPSRRVPVENPWGWLEFCPWKTRRQKPKPIYIPLTETSRMHLETLKAGRSERVFELPKSPAEFKKTREAVQREAGIKEPYLFRELRVTCNTFWDRVDPGIGEWILGHAPRTVNAKHYLVIAMRMVEAATKLPQPDAFTRGPGAHQLNLF